MLTNYTKGVGSTLKTNPFWYGGKPKLKEVDFKVVADTNAEVQAMRRGEGRCDQPDLRREPAAAQEHEGRHVQPGAGDSFRSTSTSSSAVKGNRCSVRRGCAGR